MKVRIQMIVETEDGSQSAAEEIAVVERDTLAQETLGMTLAEAKTLLAGVQKAMVTQQAQAYVETHRCCAHCKKRQWLKDTREIVVRTLFGKLAINSPRLIRCLCTPAETASFSPLSEHLVMRSTPELLYLEAKFSSLISFGATVDLMTTLLPIEDQLSVSSVHRNVNTIAQWIEDEMGDEKAIFIDGCQREWNDLPESGGRMFVSLDGGYVRARSAGRRLDGTMEIITGQCTKDDGVARRFASVQTYDEKPKRRVYDVLKAQGLQFNQDVTFLTDGGDTVRQLTEYLNPNAEHVLDWFHVTMRLTQMGQMAKGLPDGHDVSPTSTAKILERIKWKIWHGNVSDAIERAEWLQDDLESYADDNPAPVPDPVRKLLKAVHEFVTYITLNRQSIPNYGDRYRNAQPISSAIAESTVNQVISKRMCKKQQMRWTPAGAHRLLQIRVRVLDGELHNTFKAWYPAMKDVIG